MNAIWEPVIRLGTFAGAFLLLALAETVIPRRALSVHKPPRWLSNLGLVVLNTIVVRVFLPLGAVGMAVLAEARGWGLLNNTDLPGWVGVVLAVLALDFIIYLQHVLFHAVPALWRVHMVHHADLDFDVSTGLRFHTIEILLSMGIKLAAVVLLGAPALAVLIFEVLLNATSMFSHANMRLPAWLDRLLRFVVVTPDMHRVHHSVIGRETNSNFGFNLPWWDFLLGTYRAQPAQGHEGMTIGVSHLRDERRADRLPWMLALPFLGEEGSYPINQPEQHGENEPSGRTTTPTSALPDAGAVERTKRLLFVCVENSCRSQMAGAFARRHAGADTVVYTAGTRPAGVVHPKAIACMAERGCDLRDYRSKGFDEIAGLDFDVVVGMGGDELGRQIEEAIHARRVVMWDFPAPKDLPLDQVRIIRDAIEEKVRELLVELESEFHSGQAFGETHSTR